MEPKANNKLELQDVFPYSHSAFRLKAVPQGLQQRDKLGEEATKFSSQLHTALSLASSLKFSFSQNEKIYYLSKDQ